MKSYILSILITCVNCDVWSQDTGPGKNECLPHRDPSKEHVELRVRLSQGIEVRFRMGKSVRLQTLMRKFCEHKTVAEDINAVRFFFRGRRLVGKATPFGKKMKDDDVIHARLLASLRRSARLGFQPKWQF